MADQVNLSGSVASSLPISVLAASAPKAAPVKTAARGGTAETGEREVGSHSPEIAAGQLNSHLQQTSSEVRVQVDQGSGRTTFRVVNHKTGEVLLQVPSEEILAMARRVREMEQHLGSAGTLVDKEG